MKFAIGNLKFIVMFQSARIKLTAWYLLVIMLVSLLFSAVIYIEITQELNRFERFQKMRQGGQRFQTPLREFRRQSDGELIIPPLPASFDREMISQARIRVVSILGLINLGILVTAGFAGYFLAGRTLRPVKEMVDEQSRFISDASHELRTPITSLKSEIEVNLRDRKLNISQAKKILESNLEEVNNLQALSDELIKLTQYQKGNTYLDFKEESLRKIVDQACRKVSGLARQKGIIIKTRAGEVIVKGDKQGMIELLVILLDNSIKYSPKKSVVRLSAVKTDHNVVIKVKDEGMGIAKEDIPNLFDRFYRVDKARTKTGVTGYGLGLSIAKKIVDMHQGSIKIESFINKGTTVVVQLPSNA